MSKVNKSTILDILPLFYCRDSIYIFEKVMNDGIIHVGGGNLQICKNRNRPSLKNFV